ncbi:MAG: AraC family transcriptional regulator [Spirochaetales bacterium]|nr:AraC family transcriptional regulator [Spirochaetales bacterium]
MKLKKESFFIESLLDQLLSRGDALDRVKTHNVFMMKVPSNWRIEERKLGCFLFSIVGVGRGQLQLDGRAYDLGPGSVYLITPGQKHSIYTSTSEPLEINSIHFSLKDVEVGANYVFKILHWNEAEQLLDSLKDCSSVNFPSLDRFHTYTVNSSVIRILLIFRNNLRKRQDGVQFLISRISELDNIEDFSVKELAEICGYSEKAFIRTFRNIYGTTPHQYMIRIKTLRAEYLLLYSDFSIKEIASCLGYKDQYIFSKQFKNQNGYSPRIYRERFR